MIERFERFSVVISEISRHWHRITTTEMEKYELKGAHSVYLAVMLRFPEGITANRICEVCGKDKSDVSRMMSIMEKKGMVIKESVHQNQYKGVYRLTPKGKEAAEYVNERASLAVSLAGKDLSDETRAVLYSALESIEKNLHELSENGLPNKQRSMEDGQDESSVSGVVHAVENW